MNPIVLLFEETVLQAYIILFGFYVPEIPQRYGHKKGVGIIVHLIRGSGIPTMRQTYSYAKL